MTKNKVRWGILGTAEIAQKNWQAIQLSGNSTVVAVASRERSRSRRFIDQCQAEAPMERMPIACGSYEELLAMPEVEAVYIPLPTALRKPWVTGAAAAGKHVVCEKPCACTVADLEQMLAACRRHRVQFMDGVMFTHSRRMRRLRKVLNDRASIGQIKRITSAFCFFGAKNFFAHNIRVQSGLEPLGCLGDLGWYCIRLALWVMNWQMPLRVSGRLLSEQRGRGSRAAVPTEFSGELLFANGVTSGFYCSFVTDIEQWAIVSGTRGYAEIPDFVLPFAGKRVAFEVRRSDYEIRGCDFRMETSRRLVSTPEWSHGHPSAQEANCYREFAAQVRSGRLNETWPTEALQTQRVTCACLASARAQGAWKRP